MIIYDCSACCSVNFQRRLRELLRWVVMTMTELLAKVFYRVFWMARRGRGTNFARILRPSHPFPDDPEEVIASEMDT